MLNKLEELVELLKNEVSKSEQIFRKMTLSTETTQNNNNIFFRGNSNIRKQLLKYPKEEILITNGITITILDTPKFL